LSQLTAEKVPGQALSALPPCPHVMAWEHSSQQPTRSEPSLALKGELGPGYLREGFGCLELEVAVGCLVLVCRGDRPGRAGIHNHSMGQDPWVGILGREETIPEGEGMAFLQSRWGPGHLRVPNLPCEGGSTQTQGHHEVLLGHQVVAAALTVPVDAGEQQGQVPLRVVDEPIPVSICSVKRKMASTR
jgi:hypothetical protein